MNKDSNNSSSFIRYVICTDKVSSREFIGEIRYVGETTFFSIGKDITRAFYYTDESKAKSWLDYLNNRRSDDKSVFELLKNKTLIVKPIQVSYKLG